MKHVIKQLQKTQQKNNTEFNIICKNLQIMWQATKQFKKEKLHAIEKKLLKDIIEILDKKGIQEDILEHHITHMKNSRIKSQIEAAIYMIKKERRVKNTLDNPDSKQFKKLYTNITSLHYIDENKLDLFKVDL